MVEVGMALNMARSSRPIWDGPSSPNSTTSLFSNKVRHVVKRKEIKSAWEELTDGNATVGAAEVDVALGDGGHAELVVGSGEECGEGAGEHHVTVAHSAADRHAHLHEREGRGSGKGNEVGRRKECYEVLRILSIERHKDSQERVLCFCQTVSKLFSSDQST